jgi:MscS family membrane protein
MNIRLILLLSLLVVPDLVAQETPELEPAPDVPADEYDRGTPKQSGDAFVSALDVSDYERAAEYLDLRNIRGEAKEFTGPQLARRFEVVLQRGEWTDVADLADDPAGRQNDGLPGYRDSIGRVLHEGEEVTLLMQRVPRGDGEFIWKISNATVSQIPALYESYGYPDAIEELRRVLPKVTIMGYALFKWVSALALGAVTYLAVFVIALIIRRTMGDPDAPSHRNIVRFLILPFGVWATFIAMNLTAEQLGRGVTAETIARYSPLTVLITGWVMFAATSLLGQLYANRLRASGRVGSEVLVKPVENALKLIIAAACILIYMDKIGINITTVLAGLGVGGVAVALALQRPMEDVFGAVTLYAQQPVRIGDFCRFGQITGTVEEIGLRTTKVRTLANTLIAVPNSQLVNESIDNISARRKILYSPRLRLGYDTPSETVRRVLEGIRALLAEDDRVLDEGMRVRFVEIADDSLQIEIFAHIDTTVWADFLEISEDLNLKILEVIARTGTSLALPASTLKIQPDDAETLRAVAMETS